MHESLVDLFESSRNQYASSPLFGIKGAGGWRWISYGDVSQQVTAFRQLLAHHGVAEGDRVAIVADNCVPWAVAAYATFGRGAAFVPMYVAQPQEEWRFILADSGAKVVIAGTDAVYQQLQALRGELPTLQKVIGIGLPASHEDAFEYAAPDADASLSRPKGDALACIIYTSGTTGNPKGVLLTHHNICSNVAEYEGLYHIGPARSLSFLPWAHAYGQIAELHFLVSNGGSMAINDAIPNIVDNLASVQPKVLVAVPRIFNRIYDRVHRQMEARPKLIQRLFARGIALATAKRRGDSLGLIDEAVLTLADRLLFAKVRARFGGQLETLVSGSAALSREVAEFIDALGIDLYEGYGLTETSPVVATNCPGQKKVGTVGRPIPGVRVVIDKSKSEAPDEGEIIVYGPNVMQGYHNLPEETAAVMTPDGGLRTGDLGHLDADGFLTVTGRIKEQYKLENGKYVAPASLEEQIKLSPFISNAMLFGHNRPYNVLLVVPDEDTVLEWAKKRQLSLPSNWNECPQLLEQLLSEAKQACTFRSYEAPKKLAITREDFTVENGLLTPSLKIKRRRVTELYLPQLERLY